MHSGRYVDSPKCTSRSTSRRRTLPHALTHCARDRSSIPTLPHPPPESTSACVQSTASPYSTQCWLIMTQRCAPNEGKTFVRDISDDTAPVVDTTHFCCNVKCPQEAPIFVYFAHNRSCITCWVAIFVISASCTSTTLLGARAITSCSWLSLRFVSARPTDARRYLQRDFFFISITRGKKEIS